MKIFKISHACQALVKSQERSADVDHALFSFYTLAGIPKPFCH